MKEKIWVGVKGELYSALVRSGLEKNKTAERVLEDKLMKDPEIKGLVKEIRAEPDDGVLAVGPEMRRRLRESKE